MWLLMRARPGSTRDAAPGRIRLNIAGRSIDVRVSIVPTVYGERAVMRILDKTTAVLGLTDLGMHQDTFEKFNALYKSGLPPSAYGNVKLVVTPYSHAFSDPSQEAPITMVAWDHELMLQTFDQDQIVAFYKQYVDKGPESSPDPSKMP